MTKDFYIGKFVQELRSGDYDAFLTRLQAFFADFNYELNEQTERHYQVVFYIVFKLMGQFTDAEVRSARGRADAVVKTPASLCLRIQAAWHSRSGIEADRR